jgi:L-malate glycosyltransferase
MKIGVAGPITLSMLQDLFPVGTRMPAAWSFPLLALLVRELHQLGHTMTVFVLSREVDETQVIRGNRMVAYVCPQPRPVMEMASFFRKQRRALREAMQRSDCDVIHGHWANEFGGAAMESGRPHLVTVHDNPFIVLRYARHPYWMERPLLSFPVIRKAKNLTAVSPYVADWARRIGRRNDVVVIGNGVGPETFALHRVRKQPDGVTVFGAVPNYWIGDKNGSHLIEAFSILRARLGSKVQLRTFGFDFGPDGPAARWARRRKMDSGITFCGFVQNGELLKTIAEEIDVFVHPSYNEAHSMVIIEAMAMGVPVIGGDRSGAVPWMLAHGKAGLLVNIRSSVEIANGMRTLAEDIELRCRLGEEGRRHVEAACQIDRVAERYATCLETVAQGQSL